jgi:DNA-binding MarR family transcriptional regulator
MDLTPVPEDDDPDCFPTPEYAARDGGPRLPEQVAYLDLMRTSQLLSHAVRELFAKEGISGKQYNALRAIRRAGPDGATAGEIGRQMTDPRADVTRLLDRMIRDGLVARLADAKDRRVVRARLTQAGEALLSRLDAPLRDVHKTQLGHMNAAELSALSALLRKARGERL